MYFEMSNLLLVDMGLGDLGNCLCNRELYAIFFFTGFIAAT
jgi:hypothetical protein